MMHPVACQGCSGGSANRDVRAEQDAGVTGLLLLLCGMCASSSGIPLTACRYHGLMRAESCLCNVHQIPKSLLYMSKNDAAGPRTQSSKKGGIVLVGGELGRSCEAIVHTCACTPYVNGRAALTSPCASFLVSRARLQRSWPYRCRRWQTRRGHRWRRVS